MEVNLTAVMLSRRQIFSRQYQRLSCCKEMLLLVCLYHITSMNVTLRSGFPTTAGLSHISLEVTFCTGFPR